LPWDSFPGVALTAQLYLEGGVRAVEIGSLLMGRQAPTELVRLTIPRRVYTDNHMAYVAECLSNINKRRDQVRGVKITYEPPVLRHFLARFEWA